MNYDTYCKMLSNQRELMEAMPRAYRFWMDLSGGLPVWKRTDGCVKGDRKKLERRAGALMKERENIPPLPKGLKPRERWLAHYYNLRHFQPCRQVASFLASRLTGRYHGGNNVSPQLDVKWLCAGRRILDRHQPRQTKGQKP
jgi:hypothetical protein